MGWRVWQQPHLHIVGDLKFFLKLFTLTAVSFLHGLQVEKSRVAQGDCAGEILKCLHFVIRK